MDARDAKGNTALHAVWGRYGKWERNRAVVQKLLDLGTDPRAQNDLGVVADPTRCENWSDPGFRAAAGLEQVATCLAAGHNINTRDNYGATLLHSAAAGADSAAVALLLEAGADATARDHWGRTPLHARSAFKSPAILALLLGAGADVNAQSHDSTTPLHIASDTATIAALLAAGAEINARDWKGATPLFGARAEDVITALLAAGADVNLTDPWGRTPLHLYSGYGTRALEPLLAAGPDVNARDLRGRIPLHEAAEYEDASVIAALVAAGADVDARDNMGNTPLHIAWHNNSSVVETLLELGADPVAHNDRGKPAEPRNCENWDTRLFTEAVDLEGLRECLASGWDIDAPNSDGMTPLDLAVGGWPREPHNGALALLLEAGANPNVRDHRKINPTAPSGQLGRCHCRGIVAGGRCVHESAGRAWRDSAPPGNN